MLDEADWEKFYGEGYNFMQFELARAKANIWNILEEKYGGKPEYVAVETGALDAEWD